MNSLYHFTRLLARTFSKGFRASVTLESISGEISELLREGDSVADLVIFVPNHNSTLLLTQRLYTDGKYVVVVCMSRIRQEDILRRIKRELRSIDISASVRVNRDQNRQKVYLRIEAVPTENLVTQILEFILTQLYSMDKRAVFDIDFSVSSGRVLKKVPIDPELDGT